MLIYTEKKDGSANGKSITHIIERVSNHSFTTYCQPKQIIRADIRQVRDVRTGHPETCEYCFGRWSNELG